MNESRNRNLFSFLASLTVAAGMLSDSGLAAEPDVAEATAITRIAGGFAVFPRATADNEKLALDLAGRTSFVVHVTASDATAVSRIRDAGEKAGLLGKSLYVEQGEAGALPFADRLADMLVATDLKDVDLTSELKREWLRVLSPGRGTALVGGKGLKEAALRAWIKDIPGATVTNVLSGVLAVFTAPLRVGSDSWTHRCHGADNVQMSSDSTFTLPLLAQWWAAPRQDGFWGTSVVSGNGRMFTVRGSRNTRESVFLTARSLTSGLVLWQKRLNQSTNSVPVPHGGYVPGRSCAVVAGDILCMIDRDSVVLLSGETGEEQGRITGPKAGGQVKWIAVSSNMLAVLSGDADVIQTIAYQTVAANPVGREIGVYDLATKKELWCDTHAGDIDERSPAIRDGCLYYIAQSAGVVARELATGKELWKNDDAAIQANFLTPEQKKVGQLLVSQPVTLALDEVLLLRTPWAKEIVALSRKDGALLWKRGSGLTYRALTAFPVDGLLVGDKGLCIDLKTGQPAKGPKFIGSGCGPTLATPNCLVTCFGAVVDRKTGKMVRPADLKSPCDIGSLVSEGIMVTVPSECQCGFEMKCYRALASAGGIDPHGAPVRKDNLVPASGAEPATMALTDADWPTYRRDAQRSGSSRATVGTAARILWQWKPAGTVPYSNTWSAAKGPRLAPDFLATAPVAGSGNVYFASHDGMIRCLKADSGTEIWKFPTGGMLFAPPTIWEGRLFAGAVDGCVYCLDATTGKLLWKMQAAPADRRIFWMGHMINTWPMIGGVAVKDGVGFAVAGYQADSGIHAYAFDARTGKVIWEKHDAGGKGMTVGGGVAISSNAVCVAGNSGGVFDVKTGDWRVTGGSFGSEVGVLCDRWVIRGGRRLTESEAFIGSPISGGFSMNVPGATSLPAWDADLIVFSPPGANGSLMAVPTEKFKSWKDGKLQPAPAPVVKNVAVAVQATTNNTATGTNAVVAAVSTNSAPVAPPPKPKPIQLVDLKAWTSSSGMVASFALANDAAVAAFADAKGSHRLAAFGRADGTNVWSVSLPDQPAMNRLAIDRDGRVLVSLCDGSLVCAGK